MRSADVLLATALVAFAGSATAQTTPPPPATVDPSRIVAYSQSLRMVTAGEGVEKEVATVRNIVTVTESEIIHVQTVADADGVLVDSSVADRATLKPRWHRSTNDRRTLHLAFSPGRVVGQDQEMGNPPRDIKETVSDRVFDANLLDVLIAALPLAEGFRGRLSVFLWEAGGEIPLDVVVTGSATIGGRDTWAVDVTLGKTAKFNLTKGEHRVVQIVSSPAPGMEIRFVQ